MLNEILAREMSSLHAYERLLGECDYPDVRRFMVDLMEQKRTELRTLEQRVNALYGSFDPAGC